MSEILKIFTISSGKVDLGAKVVTLTLKGADVSIPAIIIGEEGRGRSRGVLPVQLPTDLHREWKEKGEVIIMTASLGETKTGNPKLFVSSGAGSSSQKAICVLRTKIGFRGSNSHTGDWTGEVEERSWGDNVRICEKFPGEIITQGTIAQGDAGRAGSGQQMIAVVPADVVFSTSYGGRLYGSPSSHYYQFDGDDITALTWEERQVSDLF